MTTGWVGPERLFTRAALPLLIFALQGCEEEGGGDGGEAERALEAEAGYEADFSSILTVREMPDGTVLVADPLGQLLLRVDLSDQTADTIGRVGGGPGEYNQPDGVWALPDGNTLLLDLGNGRLTWLDQELEYRESRPFMWGSPMDGSLIMLMPEAVDGQGRIYVNSRLAGLAEGGVSPLLRIDLGQDQIDTVALIKGPETRSRTVDGQTRTSTVPLSPEDTWGVAPDGRVVIARSEDYHLEWIDSDSVVTSGPPIPYEAAPLGQEEKLGWLDAQAEGGGGMSISVSGAPDGSLQMSVTRGAGGSTEEVDLAQYDWPQTMRAFWGRIHVDPQGRAWVRRETKAGASSLYDVFNARGERVMRAYLGERRRILGFGSRGMYVARNGPLGLQRLERYPIPSDS